MSFELSLALRYLNPRRHGFFALLTTMIAVGGVTLGVAALLVTLAVMSGFRADLQEKMLGIQPHIVLFGAEEDSDLRLAALSDKIKSVPGVRAAAPFIMGQILLRSTHGTQGVVLRGIRPREEFQVTRAEKTLLSGNWDCLEADAGPQRYLVLGKELAHNLGVTYGDELWAFSPAESAGLGALGAVPKLERFKIGGIFQCGYYDFDANMALAALPQARTLLGIAGATGFGLRTADLRQAESVSAAVAEAAGPRYWARSWQALNRNLFEALKLEKIMMTVILTMIVLVASFTIISNLILMSIEKTKEIGILRALGAGRTSVRRIFLYAGVILGAAGTILGTLLGIGIVKLLTRSDWIRLPQDIYYIDKLPAKLVAGDIGIVVASALVITVMSALYPAWRAARINPMEAIRYG